MQISIAYPFTLIDNIGIVVFQNFFKESHTQPLNYILLKKSCLMKEYLIYTFSYQLLLSTTSTLLLKIIFSIFNSNQSSQVHKLQKEYQLEQNTIPLQIFLAPNQYYTKKWINKEIKGEGGNILAHAVSSDKRYHALLLASYRTNWVGIIQV